MWCSAWPFQPNNASINARLVSSSNPLTLVDCSLCSCVSICTCVTYHDTTFTSTSTITPPCWTHARYTNRHVLYSFLSSLHQPCVAPHTTRRHAGGSAPASDCDERRPPDHHHPTTAGRASCEQNLCRHLDSTTTVNCLYLSTKPHTASFLISHHLYTLSCERGWLAAPPPRP